LPPTDRPLPRFVAEPPHELEPYGRWRETLDASFRSACDEIPELPSLGDVGDISWFPERTYGGRIYIAATAPTGGGVELFGYVSFLRGEQGEPSELVATADFTDETAAANPTWKLDLSEEVIARWRGPGKAEGDLTLVWGRPLVPGGVVATAELGGETLDQCALVQSDRFTLVALDAVTGLGDELYLDVKLWNRRGALLASESLYADEE
jgi:hypothetical protein